VSGAVQTSSAAVAAALPGWPPSRGRHSRRTSVMVSPQRWSSPISVSRTGCGAVVALGTRPAASISPASVRRPWRPNAARIAHSCGVPLARSPSSSSAARISIKVAGMLEARRTAA
jgi:hypothetical protein